jgi:hypothetical protein
MGDLPHQAEDGRPSLIEAHPPFRRDRIFSKHSSLHPDALETGRFLHQLRGGGGPAKLSSKVRPFFIDV